jgi:hypothetical protein
VEWSAGAEAPLASDGSIDVDALVQQVERETDRLSTENSLQGKLWRWQRASAKQFEETCSEPETDERDRANF